MVNCAKFLNCDSYNLIFFFLATTLLLVEDSSGDECLVSVGKVESSDGNHSKNLGRLIDFERLYIAKNLIPTLDLPDVS